MGTEPGKLVGQNSGATASDLAKKPDLGEESVGKLTQAQRIQLQRGQTGDQWIDKGAHCDGSNADGCFLADAQRNRLIIKILDRINRSATNYKIALTQMRVDELLKKEDDLPWVVSLAIDVATGFILSKVTKALTKIRTDGAARVVNAEFAAGEAVDHAKADKLLAALSDKQIETWTKKAFDAAGKQVKAVGKKAMGADDKSDKAESISYIDQLTNACDVGFERFASNATATADDGELLTLYEGLDPENHNVGLYKAALERSSAATASRVSRTSVEKSEKIARPSWSTSSKTRASSGSRTTRSARCSGTKNKMPTTIRRWFSPAIQASARSSPNSNRTSSTSAPALRATTRS